MVKRVFSAGGIVLRQVPTDAKVLAGRQDRSKGLEVLVTQHSGHLGWDFPKGHLEAGESSERAALREVEEEAGVRAKVLERIGQTQYFYYEDKQKVLKTVTFFLMEYLGEGEATTAFEVSDKVWLPVDEVAGRLTFKDTKELWEKVKEKIKDIKI